MCFLFLAVVVIDIVVIDSFPGAPLFNGLLEAHSPSHHSPFLSTLTVCAVEVEEAYIPTWKKLLLFCQIISGYCIGPIYSLSLNYSLDRRDYFADDWLSHI